MRHVLGLAGALAALACMAGCGGSGAGATGGGGSGGFICTFPTTPGSGGGGASPAAPVVQILKPMAGQVFKTTDTIDILGTASDPLDGAITSSRQLGWQLIIGATVDPIGEGLMDSVPPPHQAGNTTLRFLACDQAKNIGTAEVAIVVQ